MQKRKVSRKRRRIEEEEEVLVQNNQRISDDEEEVNEKEVDKEEVEEEKDVEDEEVEEKEVDDEEEVDDEGSETIESYSDDEEDEEVDEEEVDKEEKVDDEEGSETIESYSEEEQEEVQVEEVDEEVEQSENEEGGLSEKNLSCDDEEAAREATRQHRRRLRREVARNEEDREDSTLTMKAAGDLRNVAILKKILEIHNSTGTKCRRILAKKREYTSCDLQMQCQQILGKHDRKINRAVGTGTQFLRHLAQVLLAATENAPIVESTQHASPSSRIHAWMDRADARSSGSEEEEDEDTSWRDWPGPFGFQNCGSTDAASTATPTLLDVPTAPLSPTDIHTHVSPTDAPLSPTDIHVDTHVSPTAPLSPIDPGIPVDQDVEYLATVPLCPNIRVIQDPFQDMDIEDEPTRTKREMSASLCRADCGFYGSADTDGFCSHCHLEVLKNKEANRSGQGSPTAAAADNTMSIETCTEHQHMDVEDVRKKLATYRRLAAAKQLQARKNQACKAMEAMELDDIQVADLSDDERGQQQDSPAASRQDTNQKSQKPPVCRSIGCGFYGSQDTDGFCSKCHHEEGRKKKKGANRSGRGSPAATDTDSTDEDDIHMCRTPGCGSFATWTGGLCSKCFSDAQKKKSANKKRGRSPTADATTNKRSKLSDEQTVQQTSAEEAEDCQMDEMQADDIQAVANMDGDDQGHNNNPAQQQQDPLAQQQQDPLAQQQQDPPAQQQQDPLAQQQQDPPAQQQQDPPAAVNRQNKKRKRSSQQNLTSQQKENKRKRIQRDLGYDADEYYRPRTAALREQRMLRASSASTTQTGNIRLRSGRVLRDVRPTTSKAKRRKH